MNVFEKWFSPRTPEQIANDHKLYEDKVFPFGENQKKKINSVLSEVIEIGYDEMAMFNYLVVRQSAMNYYDSKTKSFSLEGLSRLYSSLNKTVRKKYNDNKYMYIALALIDCGIDENLNYDLDLIKNKAQEIKNILEVK